MGLLLDVGERGTLVGQTGSGKSQNAIFQLRNPVSFPVIIFDTKIEDAFFDLTDDAHDLEIVQSLPDFNRYGKLPKTKMPQYLLVRPGIEEAQDPEALNQYAMGAYHNFGKCFVYFDELYNWHNQGRATNGMIALYTRGRSRGKTVLGATQRPSWVSRFAFTEVQKFYIHRLTDKRDKKTLGEVIPEFQSTGPLPRYHFHFYEVGAENIEVYQPVPFEQHQPDKVFSEKWI